MPTNETAVTRSATRRARAAVVLGAVLVIAAHALFFARFLPGQDGAYGGHDYSYFFPRLLAGAYWFERNGPLSIPWFTPAFGGGLPFYAHPASGYVSFPQVAAIAGGAVFAARATLVVFTALGFAGTYLLLRRVFGASRAAAFFGATAFAWNGFFSARMLIGHLGFHSFALAPLAAYGLLRERRQGTRPIHAASGVVLAALVFAYMFQSGNFYGVVPVALACTALAAIAAMSGASAGRFPLRFLLASATAALLCLAKLSAALSFLDACPRSGYPLPGASSVGGAMGLLFRALFFSPPTEAARTAFENVQYALDRHEWEFGVTCVPLILFAGFAFGWKRTEGSNPWRKFALGTALALVLAIPIAVNVHAPGWGDLLKRIPIVKSSSNLVRWWSAYVPIVCVAAALALDRVPIARAKTVVLAVVAVLAMLAIQLLEDRSYYADQPYDPAAIESAFRDLRTNGRVPPIERADVDRTPDGRVAALIDRDDRLVHGVSQIACYEPMFGYRLEWFPVGSLHPGPARELKNGRFNFKNPSSYLFPRENDLHPGDHFRAEDAAQLDAFLDYRPFEFVKPERQRAAEIVNVITLGMLAAYGVVLVWSRLRR